MIKISHPNKPRKLIDNEYLWTTDLLNLVSTHGGFDKIPTKDKDAALVHYKDPSFVGIIFKLTNHKCTFCESIIETVSYINVEHFFPKSLYPEKTFEWTNLIPACGKCNSKKSNFDTKNEPFVNPMLDNPDEYLDFTDCRIKISDTAPDKTKADNTIKNCDLKRTSLTRVYATLIGGLYDTIDSVETEIINYQALVQPAAKIKKLNTILDGVQNLLFQAKPGEQHAAFVRAMLRKNPVVNNALLILNANLASLGLSTPLKI